MTIYTKKGDKGETGLPGKRRLPKSADIFEVLGLIDQANATIGLAICEVGDKELKEILNAVQGNLLAIGACLASEKPSEAMVLPRLELETEKLEKQIDLWDAKLPKLENFILPGGSRAGAILHLCRTAIRTAERALHRFKGDLPTAVPIYINRLSDFFFQAARYINFTKNSPEQIWRVV